MARHKTAPILLRGGNVLEDFKDALITESNRSGQSVNELIIRAAGERLAQRGLQFAGVFEPGDLDQMGSAR
jgi:hypothetical protein